jgi:hypothetical protein
MWIHHFVTPPRHTDLVARGSSQAYDLRVSREPADPQRIWKFARALSTGIAEGLCGLTGPWIGSDDLTSLMSVSAWMSQAGAQLVDSIEAMIRLRTALVKAGGLDEYTEPVPLLPSDEKVAVLNLARYIEDLVRRASRVGDMPATAVVERALELFAV